MDDPVRVKNELKSFYDSESADRASEAWIRLGSSARIPESKASHYFIDRKVDEALALSAPGRDQRVLEVGCSFGHMTFLLAERFREVVAVDLSSDSVALARRRAGFYGVTNVRFDEGDAEDLRGFGAGEFDTVFAFSTLRFCPDPARALREFHRVLKPGGCVVVDVPNRNCPWYGPLKKVLGITPHLHDRLFTAAEIVALMRGAGFTALRHRHILFTTKRVPDPALPLFKAADRVLESLPGIKSLSGIGMAGGRKDGGAERWPLPG